MALAACKIKWLKAGLAINVINYSNLIIIGNS